MIKMYLPNTPSRFVGKARVIKVKKVKMTCGGGMGGSVWDEYVVDYPERVGQGLIEVTDYRGKQMSLNTRYIVKVTDSQIVVITTDSQNSNFYGKKSFYYETPCDNNVVLCNEFGGNDKDNIKLIERIDL